MTWLNPLAWLGLISLAVPILIHLLARRSARVQPFPTLRFLDASRLQPIRRTRLRDPLLLALRMAILAFAVAALAGPLVPTAERRRNTGSLLARAIVIDTSASMSRPAVNGQPAVTAARETARSLAAEANTAIVLETEAPVTALAGAADWLRKQPGAREVVIVSDFQRGTVGVGDLDAVSSEVGIRLAPIETRAPASFTVELPGGTSSVTADIETTGYVSAIQWQNGGPRGAPADTLAQMASPEERDAATAALDAAIASGAPPVSGPIAVVYRGFENRDQLLRNASPVTDAAAAGILVRISDDPLHTSPVSPLPGDARTGDSTLTPMRRGGQLAALAGAAMVDGGPQLLLFPEHDAGTFESAALIASVLRAVAPDADGSELEPLSLSSEALRSMERAPATAVSSGESADDTDARRVWAIVLVLLTIEWQVRRSQPTRAGVSDE
jgi:hypothetical protein